MTERRATRHLEEHCYYKWQDHGYDLRIKLAKLATLESGDQRAGERKEEGEGRDGKRGGERDGRVRRRDTM